MKINQQWETLKEESHANIQSEKDILNRQIRSIQTEGHFGDIKENGSFRRSITGHLKKYTRNSCCMQLEEISINTLVFFMMRSKNLKKKQRKRLLRKSARSSM